MDSPLQDILRSLASCATAGVTTKFLDDQAERLCSLYGVRAAFKGYTAPGHKTPFPASLCVSVNSEVIHGIPGDYVIQEGDVVKLDMGIEKDGEFDDGALTVLIGTIDPETGRLLGCTAAARRLVQATAEALEAGCAQAKAGKTTHDIARAIEAVAKKNDVFVVHGYGGHGIGNAIHLAPSIPNEIETGSKPEVLKAGTRIAIEPMFCTASFGITYVASDGWTVKLRNGGIAAHFERTVTLS
jgi:methionyl aminopeptidase